MKRSEFLTCQIDVVEPDILDYKQLDFKLGTVSQGFSRKKQFLKTIRESKTIIRIHLGFTTMIS